MSEQEIDRDERILRLAARLRRGHFNLFLKKKGVRWPSNPDNPYEFGDTLAERKALAEADGGRRYFYELAAEIVDAEDMQADDEAWAKNGFVEPQWRATNPKHDPPIQAQPGRSSPWKPKDDT